MYIGTVFVMIAATLWAVDALIRTALTQSMSSIAIVFWEHLIGLLILSPFFVPSVKVIKRLTMTDWMWFTLLAGVSSVGGTVLFTQALTVSFSSGDFITPLLLQKLQPLIVITLSAIFLKERMNKNFIFFATLALLGGYFMSFGLIIPSFALLTNTKVVIYALGAALCWAIGTVLSKTVLKIYTAKEATMIRFLLAIPLAFILSLYIQQPISFSLTLDVMMRFVLITLSTGAVGLVIYYYGLKRTLAHHATIAELMFPFVSLLIGLTPLNPYGAAQSLTVVQLMGIVLLVLGVWKATLGNEKLPTVSGIVEHGGKNGRKLGFPTANITPPVNFSLQYGVYATTTTVEGKHYQAATHYGPRLVFNETKPLIEAHILDFTKDIYGKKITIKFVKNIRGTEHFDSMEALIKRMKLDVEETKKILG